MALFDPFTLRGVTFPNRVAVSPMSQYVSVDGHTNDWHIVHLGRFALGGAGLVFTEATAVEASGRRTHGDLGLWHDDHVAGLARIADFLKEQGAVAGIQLGHAGRKASERRPWDGETPVDSEDVALRGEAPWLAMAPSPLPYGAGWPAPAEMSPADISAVLEAFASAARRSDEAGFEVIDIYAGHGFLIHQFYSPITNRRTDAYGGSRENRMRFAVEVAEAVRSEWPDDKPLIFRISAVDWVEGGWDLDDTIALAGVLKDHGVDMLDCSSGGIGGPGNPQRMTIGHGFQVPFAAAVKEATGMSTMGVGLLWEPAEVDRMLAAGEVDMVALARELLDDPNWPLHAARTLGADSQHEMWKPQFGWWLNKRERLVKKLNLRS